jgi:protein arginine N-methyltransferase 1
MPKRATVHGVGLWWESILAPGVKLSTSPLAKPTHWEQIYLPLLEPAACEAGSVFRVSLRSDTRPDVRIRLEWKADVVRKDGTIAAGAAMDTNEGLL